MLAGLAWAATTASCRLWAVRDSSWALFCGSLWSCMKTAVIGFRFVSLRMALSARYNLPVPCMLFIFLLTNLGPGCGSMPSSVTSRNHTCAGEPKVSGATAASVRPLLHFRGRARDRPRAGGCDERARVTPGTAGTLGRVRGRSLPRAPGGGMHCMSRGRVCCMYAGSPCPSPPATCPCGC